MTASSGASVPVLAKRKKEEESRATPPKDFIPQVYINGRVVPRPAATVSVFDHGLLYGDGVFEGIRIYRVPGREACWIFRLQEHIDRLYQSAARVEINLPAAMPAAGFKQALLETVRASRDGILDPDPGKVVNYIRPVVTRGAGDLGINPKKCKSGPTVIIIVDHIDLYGEEAYTGGIPTIVCDTRRNHPMSLDGRIKSCNYLNNILGVSEANHAGVKEGIMLTLDGYVGEGTADNLFLVKNGVVLTPPTHLGILAGITRGAVLELAALLGIPAKEALLTPKFLYTADEAFFTGTGAQIVPIISIDGIALGSGRPGPITRRLIEAFPSLVEKEEPIAL